MSDQIRGQEDRPRAPPGANASHAPSAPSAGRVDKQLADEELERLEDIGGDGGGQMSKVSRPYDGAGGVRRGYEQLEHQDDEPKRHRTE